MNGNVACGGHASAVTDGHGSGGFNQQKWLQLYLA